MKATDGKHHERVFDSWAEFVAYAERSGLDGYASQRRGHGGKVLLPELPRVPWEGTRTFPQAMALAREGWTDALGLVADVTRAIETDVQPMVKNRWASKYDVRGSSPSVSRYVDGRPKNMRRRVRVQVPQFERPVRLLCSGAYSSGVDTSVIVQRGAAMIALVDAVRRAGRPVEVWLDYRFRHRRDVDETLSYQVPIMRAGQPISPGILQFAIAHPASLRRVCFAAMEGETDALRQKFRIGGTYATPAQRHEVPGLDSWDFYLDSATYGMGEHQWKTTDGAVRWILERLADFGVALKD
jgi:hypothetical protein